MKRLLMLLLVFFLFPVEQAFSQSSAKREHQTQNQILLVIRNFGEVWAKNDIATLDSLLSEDYIHTDYLGKVQKRLEWLEYVKDRKDKGIVNRIEFADVQIRIYGDVAVATGRNIIKGDLTDQHKDTATQIRFTQVLVKKQGKWLRSAFQATPIAS